MNRRIITGLGFIAVPALIWADLINIAQVSYQDASGSHVSLSNQVIVQIVPVGVQSPPDPDLNGLPATLSIDGTLSLSNADRFVDCRLIWSLEPAKAVNVQHHEDRLLNHSGVGTISMTGSSPRLSNSSLSPGFYLLSVYAERLVDPSLKSAVKQKYITLVSANMDSVRVYPNPWRQGKATGEAAITFTGLPLGAAISIFTVSGHQIRTLRAAGDAQKWDLQTDAGTPAASGIYLYLITSTSGSVRGKLAIIR